MYKRKKTNIMLITFTDDNKTFCNIMPMCGSFSSRIPMLIGNRSHNWQ